MKFLMTRTALFLLFALSFAHGAFEPGKKPCAYLARGSSGIAVEGMESGFMINPSLLALKGESHISLFYRNYYGLPQLNEIAMAFKWNVFHLPFGFFVSQFGDKNYHEQELYFATSWSPFENFSLGISVSLYFLRIKNYGQSVAFGNKLAFRYKLLPHLNFATTIGNLNEPKLNHKRGEIPVYFISGFEFLPIKSISISFDIFKDNRFDFDFRYGLGYQLNSYFEFLVGFRQQVHTFTSGIQIKKAMFHVNYAFEIHPDLGFSNAFEVAYVF